MSRYDKYDGVAGGFRALLDADFAYTNSLPDWKHASLGTVLGVSLNANGRIVIGTGGGSGLMGVLVLTEPKAAGEAVDVMTSGEIVEFTLSDGTAATAGTAYGSQADGDMAAGAGVGVTAEATRLVVRVELAATAIV